MRVLVVTTSFPRHGADWAGRFVLDQAKALAARGHEVAVVAPDDAGARREEVLEGVSVRRVRYAWPRAAQVLAYGAGMPENVRRRPWALAELPSLVAALGRAVAQAPCDVVLAHWALAGWAAARTATKRGLGLATTMNGSDLRLALTPGRWQRIVRHALDGSTRAVVLGSAMAEEAVKAGLTAAAKVVVAPYGVDDDLIGRNVGLGEAGRVTFVGRLLESKGLVELAEAVGRLEGARLVCVGDGPLRATLEGLPHVSCLGPLDRRELLDEMARAAVLALPSHGEGLPITLLEAMALARPVVATPVGAVPELLQSGLGRDRSAGIVVPVGDVEALAAALQGVLDDRQRAAALGSRARARIADAYTWSAAASRLESVLETCRREAARSLGPAPSRVSASSVRRGE